MPAKRQLRSFDLKQITGRDSLIGVDEAGRGALAGPVVAAAVWVNRDFLEGQWVSQRSAKVNDSKQLSAEDRNDLYAEFELLSKQGLIKAHAGLATVAEIEENNILGATKIAMRRAIEAIHPPEAFIVRDEPDLFSSLEDRSGFTAHVNCRILIDGVRLRGFPYPHEPIVKGDARSLCIAMASIVAKVTRDRLMDALALSWPAYGFERHKGYGTEDHRNAILAHGPCREHRGMFLRKLMAQRGDPSQMDWTVASDDASEDSPSTGALSERPETPGDTV